MRSKLDYDEIPGLTQRVLLSGDSVFFMGLTKEVAMRGVYKLELPRVLRSLQGNQSDSTGNYALLRENGGQRVLAQLARVQSKRAVEESLLPLVCDYFAKAANDAAALSFFLQELGPAPSPTLLESLIEANC